MEGGFAAAIQTVDTETMEGSVMIGRMEKGIRAKMRIIRG